MPGCHPADAGVTDAPNARRATALEATLECMMMGVRAREIAKAGMTVNEWQETREKCSEWVIVEAENSQANTRFAALLIRRHTNYVSPGNSRVERTTIFRARQSAELSWSDLAKGKVEKAEQL